MNEKIKHLRKSAPTHGEDGERLPYVPIRRPTLSAAKCPIIAPVCATCGHEIDKNGLGWFHVAANPGYAAGAE
jgi:hypothetical protein